MESIILGWYILVETGSVLLLTVFASLQYFGTLLPPVAGVVGHRIGNKRLIASMRGSYALLATTLMTLALTGVLEPLHVFIIGTMMGLMRHSDLVMRYAYCAGSSLCALTEFTPACISRRTASSQFASSCATCLVPRVGWPAKGISKVGVKIRTRRVALASLGGSTTVVFERLNCSARACMVAVSSALPFSKSRHGLPASADCANTFNKYEPDPDYRSDYR